MPARALMIAILLLVFARYEAVSGIIELPDRVIAELHGAPTTPAPAPPPESSEPYLVERFVEHADYYEVELIGKPDGEKHNPGNQDGPVSSPAPTLTAQAAADPPPSSISYGSGSPPAVSPYYQELSERIRTLQRERQECLKTTPGEERADRERKRREADEKLREIRAVSAEMAQLRSQEGS